MQIDAETYFVIIYDCSKMMNVNMYLFYIKTVKLVVPSNSPSLSCRRPLTNYC